MGYGYQSNSFHRPTFVKATIIGTAKWLVFQRVGKDNSLESQILISDPIVLDQLIHAARKLKDAWLEESE